MMEQEGVESPSPAGKKTSLPLWRYNGSALLVAKGISIWQNA
jgi:hypothetical protein